MKSWKVLFIGVGSIAKRHIKNLTYFMKQRNEKLSIDAYRSDHGHSLPEEIRPFVLHVYYDQKEVPEDYDVIFVTNPTQFHLQAIQCFHTKGKHFFIEKPLCAAGQLNALDIAWRPDSIYYVAAPLRYSSVLQYVKVHIKPEEVLSVRCISSSYLPDWRPGIDYRQTYSAHKELGGGVSIDLIHEWDYITFLFGFPVKTECLIRKLSDLEIDSDDIAVYIADFGHMLAEVHVDYIGQSPVRTMEIITKDEVIACDLLKSSILYKKSGRMISFEQKRDEYQIDEIRYFWSLIDGQIYGIEHIEHACKVLRIAGGL